MTQQTIQKRLNHIREMGAQLKTPIKLMEVCGTHTMTTFKSGLRHSLPENVRLISGPGCPVCVTPIDYIDKAITIAKEPNVIITTFGDMIRVPGSTSSLELARAGGADIRIIYSPTDALELAKNTPNKTVVFLGVGFETTTPPIAWTIKEASDKHISNYKVLCAHKTMPQAMTALLKDQQINLSGFVCPGHVSVIIGAKTYQFIANDYKIPCVVTGFEPIDMVIGIEMLLEQIMNNRASVEIQYTRSVKYEGNLVAQSLLNTVFKASDSNWRGLGIIPGSGLTIKDDYKSIDAETFFSYLTYPTAKEPQGCCCGDVLRGTKTPLQCPLFNKICTPAQPVGACMVSGEGTCAAYYKYEKY